MTEATIGPLMMDLAGTSVSAAERDQLRHPAVGGVILFTRNYESPDQLAGLVRAIRELRPELLIAADTEGGRVQRFRRGFLRLPAVARYGTLYGKDAAAALQVAYAGGWLLAAELRALDVDLAFAPVVDIDGGLSAVIGDRAFARDVEAVSALAAAHAQGLRAAGMAATAKHYPGHGFVAPDSHQELPEDRRRLEQVEALDERPYRTLIAGGLESVMVAHVLYPEVDERPASVSSRWIARLRHELGFRGAVFSDDLSMGGLAGLGDVHARFEAARGAGCDMIPVCNQPGDVAALLDRGAVGADEAGSRRLRALQGRGQSAGLEQLRASPEYARNFNIMRSFIEIGVES